MLLTNNLRHKSNAGLGAPFPLSAVNGLTEVERLVFGLSERP
jgi:hypothetical protein